MTFLPLDSVSRDRRRAALRAAGEALGAPALVLGASYVGFGSLVRELGLGLDAALISTLSAWALPGQVALVELHAVGASLFAIGLAVLLTNARLMPMTVVLMPLLRDPRVPRWRYFVAANLVAVTGWAGAMRRCPELPVHERLPHFVGFASALWAVSLLGTALGFGLAGSVPESVALGLVFLNPIYFMLVFASDLRQRARAFALALGAVAGPILHLVDPDWGLLATGLIAGSAGFLLDRAMRRRGA